MYWAAGWSQRKRGKSKEGKREGGNEHGPEKSQGQLEGRSDWGERGVVVNIGKEPKSKKGGAVEQREAAISHTGFR